MGVRDGESSLLVNGSKCRTAAKIKVNFFCWQLAMAVRLGGYPS